MPPRSSPRSPSTPPPSMSARSTSSRRSSAGATSSCVARASKRSGASSPRRPGTLVPIRLFLHRHHRDPLEGVGAVDGTPDGTRGTWWRRRSSGCSAPRTETDAVVAARRRVGPNDADLAMVMVSLAHILMEERGSWLRSKAQAAVDAAKARATTTTTISPSRATLPTTTTISPSRATLPTTTTISPGGATLPSPEATRPFDSIPVVPRASDLPTARGVPSLSARGISSLSAAAAPPARPTWVPTALVGLDDGDRTDGERTPPGVRYDASPV